MEFAPGPYGATGPARETSRLTTKNRNNNHNHNNNNNNKPRTLSRQPSGQGLVAPGQGLGPGLGIEFPTRPPTTGASGGIKDNYTGGYGYGSTGGAGGGYGTSSMGVGGSGIGGGTGGGGGSTGGGGDTVVHYLDEVGSIGDIYQQYVEREKLLSGLSSASIEPLRVSSVPRSALVNRLVLTPIGSQGFISDGYEIDPRTQAWTSSRGGDSRSGGSRSGSRGIRFISASGFARSDIAQDVQQGETDDWADSAEQGSGLASGPGSGLTQHQSWFWGGGGGYSPFNPIATPTSNDPPSSSFRPIVSPGSHLGQGLGLRSAQGPGLDAQKNSPHSSSPHAPVFFWTGQLPTFYDENQQEEEEEDLDEQEDDEDIDSVNVNDKNDLQRIAEKFLPKEDDEEEQTKSKVKVYSVIARMFKTSVASLQKVTTTNHVNNF